VHVRVDLLPQPPYDDVVILIDVLRTCTVAPILFDNGLSQLHIVTKLTLARTFAQARGALLLGERGGLPPEGFNFGNSPAELSHHKITGEAVLVSENAPKILPKLHDAPYLLLGSLYNAAAVAQAALELSGGHIYIVCCGLLEQEDLDDSLAAGVIATLIKEHCSETQLTGGARLAAALLRAFPDPLEALWRSSTGHYLRSLNMVDDLAVASLVSQSEVAPRMRAREMSEDGNIYTFTRD
jgi:2-phosphosulfolactate phosphatase